MECLIPARGHPRHRHEAAGDYKEPVYEGSIKSGKIAEKLLGGLKFGAGGYHLCSFLLFQVRNPGKFFHGHLGAILSKIGLRGAADGRAQTRNEHGHLTDSAAS